MIVDEYYRRLLEEFIRSPDYLKAGVVAAVVVIGKGPSWNTSWKWFSSMFALNRRTLE